LKCCKCVICSACGGCRNCKLRSSDPRGDNLCMACKTIAFEESKGWFRGRKYSQLPASTSALYIDACAYSLLSLLAAEGLLATYSVRPSSPLNAVGQITAVVIAVTTAIRLFGYSCSCLFGMIVRRQRLLRRRLLKLHYQHLRFLLFLCRYLLQLHRQHLHRRYLLQPHR
jgi:hypothetical protein